MKINYIWILSLLTGLLLFSCKEAVEPDLKNKSITIYAPADKDSISSSPVTFWWEKLEGATKYRLQIVKPNFDKIQQFIADTNVAGDKFVKQLGPGPYQWRIMAYNSNSQTAFQVRSFKMDSTLNLSNTKVILKTPADKVETNIKVQTFSWEEIANATHYKIEFENAVIGSGVVLSDSKIVKGSTAIQYTWPGAGKYKWRVTAVNDNTNTESKSEWRQFYLLLDAPTALKTKKDSIVHADSCKWVRPLTAVSDTLYFSKQSSFSTIDAKVAIPASTESFWLADTIILPRKNTWYWKVRSFDALNNKSMLSNAAKFYMK